MGGGELSYRVKGGGNEKHDCILWHHLGWGGNIYRDIGGRGGVVGGGSRGGGVGEGFGVGGGHCSLGLGLASGYLVRSKVSTLLMTQSPCSGYTPMRLCALV